MKIKIAPESKRPLVRKQKFGDCEGDTDRRTDYVKSLQQFVFQLLSKLLYYILEFVPKSWQQEA